ncbi:hypothetical protein CIRMBP1279_00524 [Enterococcus cecorum]|uniref:FxLYD domain-containing protein n=1 Tax=Enterococcus cecorum TaxID=44008 RepID=UPI0022DA0311|nr:FxLYD domain-containing protein [Enterococcus cecorum]CAI3253752.1 hypothetical protein CIRMBP1285_00044 [Enterococcus cecorum]CAI3253920.1 hypothetical protein CIRMBP1278_00045 [Enterococcus cecorum]CAI3266927.1 hypothetical protein CIRMBP1280_00239 [Enterococcus cecorum]CAI3297139.1 hypothetical protein CIRMBP1279_00524 [Enterococcus cecorum]CAI3301769.1 hypothetical protein CIRMBP1299_00045 [Enterococcus cecorum]
MKKIRLILSIILGLFIISGCSNDSKIKTTTSSSKEEFADKAFLEDFKQGLYDRWDYQNGKESDKDYETNLKTYYKKLADKELDSIKKYKNAKFKDSQLHEYALSYINNLEKSKTLSKEDYIAFEFSDGDVVDNMSIAYGKVYSKRIMLIRNIVNKYDVKTDKKHKESLSELLDNAKLADKKQQEIESVNNIFKNVTFTKNPNDDTEYTAVVENNTNFTFNNILCSYRLLLSDNTVVNTSYISIQKWAPHQKYTISMYSNDTFDKTELLNCDYEIER